jgi:hypothetical protein
MSNQKNPVLVKAAKSQPGFERRAWVRQASELEAFCEPIAGEIASEREMSWSAKVHDISAGGLGLILQRRFEHGTTLILELSGKKEIPDRTLFVTVVHVQAHGRNKWLVGCAFANPLADDELRAFLDA